MFRTCSRLFLSTAAIALVVSAFGSEASAGGGNPPIVVNSRPDVPDADLGDGVCDTDLEEPGLQCTLRAAIQHANVTPGPDTITLPAGVYKLKRKGAEENAAATGDLDITDTLAIQGDGPVTTVIDGKGGKDRVFDVFPGVNVFLEGIMIRGGKTPKKPDDELETSGGGVRSHGIITLKDCVVMKCRADDDGGGLSIEAGSAELIRTTVFKCKAKDDGGGLDNDAATVVVTDSAFVKNKAKDEAGALENSHGTVTLTNVTFSGNKAKNEAAAVNNEDGGTMTITNCTFFLNKSKTDVNISTADDNGGFNPNTTTVTNTIFAGKGKKPNCQGELTSGGGNLDTGDSCGFGLVNGANDLVNTDPRLDKKLRNNGGLTGTHALLDDSPCIDSGEDGSCPPADQRGVGRVDVPEVGTSTCDRGAYEFVPEGEGEFD